MFKRLFKYLFTFNGVLLRTDFCLISCICLPVLVFFHGLLVGLMPENVHELIRIIFMANSYSWMVIIRYVMFAAVIRRLRDIGCNPGWSIVLLVLLIFPIEENLKNTMVLSGAILLSLVPGTGVLKGNVHLVNILKLLAEADGKVASAEVDVFRRFCVTNIGKRKYTKRLVCQFEKGALNPYFSFEYHFKKMIKKNRPYFHERVSIIDTMIRMAEADGAITEDETALLEITNRFFEVDEELNQGVYTLIAMIAKLAKADGHVSKREIELINTFIRQELNFSETKRKKAVEVFQYEKRTGTSFREYAKEFYLIYQEEKTLLNGVFTFFRELASADGVVDHREAELLETAARIFRIDHKNWTNQPAQGDAARLCRNREAYYASVLGVPPDARMNHIRTQYKKLIQMNHPDKVASMGDAIKAAAELETKKLNDAYEYFKIKEFEGV